MRPAILLALVLALAAAPALLPARAHAASAAPAAAQDGAEFRSQFEAAMKINAVDEMAKLVKRNDREAVDWIMETCEAISARSNETLEARIAALRVAWKKAFETEFVDEVYEYFSLLSAQGKRMRHEAKQRFDKARSRYLANLEEKDQPTFTLLEGEYEALSKAFAEIGDHYYASQAWVFTGLLNSEEIRGPKADLYAAYAAYEKAIEHREKIGLKDRTYLEIRQSHQHLKAQGYDAAPGGKAEPGAGAPAGGGAPVEAGPKRTAAMTFELVEEVDAFERPTYTADEFYQIWERLYFEGKGSVGKFHRLADLSPSAVREGDSEVVIDADRDGEGEVDVPMTGNLEVVKFDIGSGDEKRPWAVLTTVGQQTDQYQGMQVNLAPTTDSLSVYAFNAGSMVGDIDGTRVQVLDDNMDGVYGSLPTTWENLGMSKGYYQPELDCVVVAEGDRARPWTQYLRVGEGWYEVEAQQGGTQLAYAPAELETGTLKLDFEGGDPAWLIVRGEGRWENCFYDLVEGGSKGVQVPAGRYSLFYGELRKGKRRQMMKALILPGTSTTKWTVLPGEELEVKLGAPFGFDFQHEVSGEKLTVKGQSVVVTGSAGERYERVWNAVAEPEVSWREKGSRRGSKPEEMPKLVDTDPMYSEGWIVAWFPRDLVLEVGEVEGPVEVQLTQKKHKLFGKIESAWKE